MKIGHLMKLLFATLIAWGITGFATLVSKTVMLKLVCDIGIQNGDVEADLPIPGYVNTYFYLCLFA